MKTITIDVTVEHINKGQHSGLRCPVAIALNATLKGGFHALVGPDKAFICNQPIKKKPAETVMECRLPAELSQFVRNWDNRQTVRPAKFELTFERVNTNG